MKNTAKIIQRKVDSLHLKDTITIMLTGGRSAAILYNEWRQLPRFKQLSNVIFYFGDERCVSPDHLESNYGMAMKTLFLSGIPDGCSVHRIQGEEKNLETAARKYEALLPSSIDILILGVGEDGHIASLFPFSSLLHEKSALFAPVKMDNSTYNRLTITPLVIESAKVIFVLVPGASKLKILKEAKEDVTNIDLLPLRLVKSAIWCFD